MKNYRIGSLEEYDDWFSEQSKKAQLQIQKRLYAITEFGHFGVHRSVSDDDTIWELKWKNGRRIYYCYLQETRILLLLGGNKNGQEKDIKKAENILAKISADKGLLKD